ncbi:MAG: PEP-CTERM sorting domain-containing protein, partial [Rickettsiales bacterium]|nr:PEP-CTERM sorting domain-containing protein [Rickettsiales bacterium]
KHAVQQLRPHDYFRIIRFGHDASEFSSSPMQATTSNIEQGMHFINSLRASGGTEIPSAIRKAFASKPKEGTMRIVVFLTDGYIGNESEVLGLIGNKIGKARIYAFGVGTSVNRYLLSEMGRMGRGFARYIDPTETGDDAAISLAKALNSTILTDISIDWGTLTTISTTPDIIPDLFGGQTLRILGKYTNTDAKQHVIKVNGLINNQKASLPIHLDLAASSDESTTAIPLMWARSNIADKMRKLHRNKRFYNQNDLALQDTLKEEITKLGLDFSLSTKWTSFVAVSEKIYNPNPQDTKESNVPLPMVKGITGSAYGTMPQSAINHGFSGHSTPEPEALFGLMTIGTIAGISALRRRKKRGTVVSS